jgi:hypothetical protein
MLLEKTGRWQTDCDSVTRRFQFEWEEYKRLHQEPLPLKLAERLDWLAKLVEGLPHATDLNDQRWDEIRTVAKESLSSMKSWL